MKKCILLASILIFYIIPPLACASKEKQPCVYNSKSNSPTISRNKMRCSSNGEKSGEGEDKERFCEEKKTLVETYRLQYTQLLETHRCHLNVLLFTLSLYLAVMSACFTIVCRNIEKMKKAEIGKKSPKTSSKTLLFILIFFAVVASVLFIKGLDLGREDALKRSNYIACVAKTLDIEPIEIKLLEELFRWMRLAPMVIISLWFAVLLRGMMECGCNRIPILVRWPSLLIGLIWIGGYIRSLIPFLTLFRQLHWITIIVIIWFAMLFLIGVISAIKQKTQ